MKKPFSTSDKKRKKFSNKEKSLLKWLFFVCAVFLAAWYVSTFWYQLMLIQGSSMEPSYRNLQLVVLDKHSKDYKKGDVIAFTCDELSSVLVKRIAGGPGESAQIIDGSLFINGTESVFYHYQKFDYAGILTNEVKTGENEYIVIGDNISESIDSRYEQVNVVNSENIIGKVIIFP
ncbi:MAG: signal peptidase I [Huintestinicola sp.]|uniref:signal peptidase I n=1 Tax=Huintestinicola sp. TaxID=2981661 RepID=UPI003F0ECE13